jgi:hypothetical protein
MAITNQRITAASLDKQAGIFSLVQVSRVTVHNLTFSGNLFDNVRFISTELSETQMTIMNVEIQDNVCT